MSFSLLCFCGGKLGVGGVFALGFDVLVFFFYVCVLFLLLFVHAPLKYCLKS